MSTRLLSVTVLLLTVCLCFQASAGSRRFPTKGKVPLCCTRVSSADISADIIGKYTIQKARGECVEAIIFRTAEEKVCVDPKAKWVQRVIADTHHENKIHMQSKFGTNYNTRKHEIIG
uniref:eotaxin-like n=1 Tax=Monopterus albus TaxID=43700 RepID=UPI0009B4962B|nr:eotaxin-like [Monopterus albus]